MRAVDRRDRVELDRAEAVDRRFDVAGGSAAEARSVRLRRYGEPPNRGEACNGGALPWERGWIVVPDRDRDASRAIARERPAGDGVTIRGNRPVADYVSFTAAGHARRFDGALQMGTFTVCRAGKRARQGVLAGSGRASRETSTDICP